MGAGGVDDEVGDAHARVDAEALLDVLLGADQVGGIDVLVGHSSHRLAALASQEEVLDLLGLVLPAVAAEEVVVVVLRPGTHAADVEPDRVACRLAGIGDRLVVADGELRVPEDAQRTSSADRFARPARNGSPHSRSKRSGTK